MADTLTTNLELTKPEIGGDQNLWGSRLNVNFDLIDTAVHSAAVQAADALSKTSGGTVAGPTTFSGTLAISGALSVGGAPLAWDGTSLKVAGSSIYTAANPVAVLASANTFSQSQRISTYDAGIVLEAPGNFSYKVFTDANANLAVYRATDMTPVEEIFAIQPDGNIRSKLFGFLNTYIANQISGNQSTLVNTMMGLINTYSITGLRWVDSGNPTFNTDGNNLLGPTAGSVLHNLGFGFDNFGHITGFGNFIRLQARIPNLGWYDV